MNLADDILDRESHLERSIQREIRLEIGNPREYPDVVLWPNVVGLLEDANGKKRRVGLVKGSSDLVGIFTRRDGVGMWISAEIKSATGRQSLAQRNFQAQVIARGGSYAVLRSVEDARRWIAGLRSSE